MNFLTQQQEVASNVRLDLTQSAQKTIVQRWLNMAGKEIWSEYDWNWALDRQIVQTVIDDKTGTVTVNAGSTTVTGTSTAFAASEVGSYIQFSSSNDWYKITAVANAGSLTIESPYVGTTTLSAGTFIIRKFFYSLGGSVDKILSARQAISPQFINVVNYRDFDIFRPNPTTTGNPLSMIVYGVDSNGNIQFTPWPWPSQAENLEIRVKKSYTELSADTDTSAIPAQYHSTVMIDGAMWRGYQYLSVNNVDYAQRAMAAFNRYRAELQNMKSNSDPDEGYHLVIDNRDQTYTPFGPILPFKYGQS